MADREPVAGGGMPDRGTVSGGAMADGEMVALRAARLVDVEAGEVLEGRMLLVRGERIEAVLGPGQAPPGGPGSSTCPATRCCPG